MNYSSVVGIDSRALDHYQSGILWGGPFPDSLERKADGRAKVKQISPYRNC
jgi:hypothetical protein